MSKLAQSILPGFLEVSRHYRHRPSKNLERHVSNSPLQPFGVRTLRSL
jgi:hypothetical protein